jgi:hypothetical protein
MQVKLPLLFLMRSRHCSVVAFVLASLLAWAVPASADWSELVKDDDITPPPAPVGKGGKPVKNITPPKK